MWSEHSLESLPFLRRWRSGPAHSGVWLWHMGCRIVCEQSKLWTSRHIEHVSQRHVVMIDGLYGHRYSTNPPVSTRRKTRFPCDHCSTLSTTNPFVLHSLSPIRGHIFGRNGTQRLITKEANLVFHIQFPNRITSQPLDWFETKILSPPLAKRDRLRTGLPRA